MQSISHQKILVIAIFLLGLQVWRLRERLQGPLQRPGLRDESRPEKEGRVRRLRGGHVKGMFCCGF